MDEAINITNLAMAYLMYVIATISPGPATLAISNTSMQYGRRAGLTIAVGVMIGSLTWGVLAALGLSAFLTSSELLMKGLYLFGGLYLLWLASKLLRSALRKDNSRVKSVPMSENRARSFNHYFLKGLAIHLTNPKSIFAWLAIIAVGVDQSQNLWTPYLVVGGCWLMGVVIFSTLAIVFSAKHMASAYLSFRRWIDSATAVVFVVAAVKLLLSSAY